jgi:hypothetical protein
LADVEVLDIEEPLHRVLSIGAWCTDQGMSGTVYSPT